MEGLPIQQLVQLGSTTVVAIIAILALVQVIKNKGKNRQNNQEFIKELRENHLRGIETKLENLEYMGRENDKKLEKIINLLIAVKEKLK